MSNRVLRPAWTRSSDRLVKEREQRRRAAVEARRDPVARSLYQTPQWRALRRQVLSQEPICRTRLCGERAVVVDHVRPHRGSEQLFFDRANLAGRCKLCHDRKTARYDGGFGNPRKEYPR